MALSGIFYQSVSSDQYRLQIEWSATQDIGANTSNITANLYWLATTGIGISSSVTKDGFISIGGTSNSFSGAGLAGLSGNQKKLIHTYSRTLSHDPSTGELSTEIIGSFDVEVTISGSFVSNVTTSQTVTLDTIPRTPTAPTSCTAGGSGSGTNLFHYGDNISVSWSGATGYITGYDLEYAVANKDSGVYGSWSGLLSNANQTSFSSAWGSELAGTKYKFRVRACNGSLKSSYTESGEVIYKGVINIKISGAYKKGTAFVKVSGTWRRCKTTNIKISGTWRESV